MNAASLDAPLAIVDLETTGAHPALDRITEVAVIEVEGLRVTSQWSTLVNPECTIPSPIQALTGITSEMVARAPRFATLARELFERLGGRVFVAHNARFDYGFLRREFERSGLKFMAKTLCTVRLSRRLYPQHARHNLDSLIERHGIACHARHRALGDADALWQFLRIAVAEHGPEVVAVAARQIARQPALPPHIDADTLPLVRGLFRSRRAALSALRALADEHRLCLQTLGFDTAGNGVCFRHQIGRCGGVCAGKENVHLHHARLGAALLRYDAAAWPHGGPIGIVERDRAEDATEVHVVDRWCYLGAASCDAEVEGLLEARRSARFDYDHYRILARHLGKRGVRVLPLQAAA